MVPATTTRSIEEIGQVVARERNRRGWSQQQLADIAGVNRTSIVNIENPQRARSLNVNTMLNVLDVLELRLGAMNQHRHDYEEVCKVCGQKR